MKLIRRLDQIYHHAKWEKDYTALASFEYSRTDDPVDNNIITIFQDKMGSYCGCATIFKGGHTPTYYETWSPDLVTFFELQLRPLLEDNMLLKMEI